MERVVQCHNLIEQSQFQWQPQSHSQNCSCPPNPPSLISKMPDFQSTYILNFEPTCAIFQMLKTLVQYFKFRTHLCNISNFEHTCAIFRTLNTLVQYFQFWTQLCKNVLWCHGSPRVELLYIVEADRSKWGPSKDRRVKKSWWQFPSLCLFVRCSKLMKIELWPKW